MTPSKTKSFHVCGTDPPFFPKQYEEWLVWQEAAVFSSYISCLSKIKDTILKAVLHFLNIAINQTVCMLYELNYHS